MVEDLIAAGLLLAGVGAFVANGARKVNCCICNKSFPNGKMKKLAAVTDKQFLDLDWTSDYERPDLIDIIAKTRILMGVDVDRVIQSSATARKDKEKLGSKKVCEHCIEKIAETLNMEADKKKVPCPNCGNKFWEHWLEVPSQFGLPVYWKFGDNFDKKVCYDCRNKIVAGEIDRYNQVRTESRAFEKQGEYEWHPHNHQGAWKRIIDESTVVEGISSPYYRNRDDALSYLWERAFYEGFNIIFNVKFSKQTAYEPSGNSHIDNPNYVHGVHPYSEYCATGDFAKKKM